MSRLRRRHLRRLFLQYKTKPSNRESEAFLEELSQQNSTAQEDSRSGPQAVPFPSSYPVCRHSARQSRKATQDSCQAGISIGWGNEGLRVTTSRTVPFSISITVSASASRSPT